MGRWAPEARRTLAKLFEEDRTVFSSLFNKWLLTCPDRTLPFSPVCRPYLLIDRNRRMGGRVYVVEKSLLARSHTGVHLHIEIRWICINSELPAGMYGLGSNDS